VGSGERLQTPPDCVRGGCAGANPHHPPQRRPGAFSDHFPLSIAQRPGQQRAVNAQFSTLPCRMSPCRRPLNGVPVEHSSFSSFFPLPPFPIFPFSVFRSSLQHFGVPCSIFCGSLSLFIAQRTVRAQFPGIPCRGVPRQWWSQWIALNSFSTLPTSPKVSLPGFVTANSAGISAESPGGKTKSEKLSSDPPALV